jgi:molybdenum cofactor biosynthesis enzyme MoaA
MPSVSFGEIVDFARKQPHNTDIFVNGHGKSAFHPEWLQLCKEIVASGFRPSITTNLAKPLDSYETACLAVFNEIQVCIDTFDPKQLKDIRRRVKLSTIIDKIRNIRAAAESRHVAPPKFTVSCGVYDLNYPLIGRLAEFCISMGIGGVTFWQLVKYEDLADAIRHVEDAVELLQRNGVHTVVAGEFLNDWRRLTARHPKGQNADA